MYAISGSGNRMLMPSPAIRATVGHVTDPYAAYLVYDTFTDTAGVHLHDHTPEKGGPWTDVVGTISITGNKSTVVWNGRAVATGAADVDINCSVTIGSGGASESGLIFRYQDANNFLWAGYDMTWQRPVVYEVVAGTPAEIGGHGTFVHSQSDQDTLAMRVVTSGTSVKFYIAGTLEVDITEASFQTATGCGLYCQHFTTSYWDNFTVA